MPAKDKGAVDGPSLAKLMASKKRECTFAQIFPTGTHALWLCYRLAFNGIGVTAQTPPNSFAIKA